MSLQSVFAKTPPLVGCHKKDSGMEDKERCDNDNTLVSDDEMHSDDSPMKGTEDEPEVLPLPSNGMITETPSWEDVSKEDLEDGELEEGEIDDDDEIADNDEVTEDVADSEQQQPPEQLEKIPPLLLNLKNIARHAPDEEEEGDRGSGAEGTPSGSSNEEHQSHTVHKKKKKKKQKKKRKREEKEMKKKKKYIDHDQVEEYPAELDSANAPWSGSFRGQGFFRSTSSSKHCATSYNDIDAPDHSPPGPYDSPYDSPPGPYDSPSDEDEFGPPPKLQRYDDEKSRYRASKKASLLSMLEDGYMDANVAANESKELFDHELGKGGLSLNKQKKQEKAKYYRELQKQRDMRNNEAGKQQRPICKFYKEGKCAKGNTCQFSHDVRQQHRPEICKFYLNSVCSKGDNCLYMHGTFPCRFFHAAGGCIHGDNCRFSHEELTEETQRILERVLAEKKEDKLDGSSPRKKPSLLGSPPRHLREQVMGSSPRDQQVKKIPSLFDIKVFPPSQSQRMKSPSQGPPGPMSPPPRGMGPAGFYSEMRPSPNRMPIRPNMMMPPPGMVPPRGMMPPDVNREGLLAHPGMPPLRPQGMYFNEEHGNPQPGQQAGSQNPFFGLSGPDTDKSTSGTDDGTAMPSGQTDPSDGDKYNIPVHLAPKQRELFLRIQQQQRERDVSVNAQQNSKDKDDENDNWYSSDEEDAPKPPTVPSNILQNLGIPPGGAMPPKQQAANQQAPVLNIAQMLNVIRNVTSQPPTTMGDGHLGGMNPGRDPRMMMGQQPTVDPRTGLPHPAPKANDPRLHSATSNMSSMSLDASITIDASLAQSGGGVPYVVRRLPTFPALCLPTSVNMFDPRYNHDPRVQKLIKKLEPSLIQQQMGKGDGSAKTRIIPLVGENETLMIAEPVAPPPQALQPLALPPLLQNTVLSSVLASGALQQMARFPQPRFQQPPPNIVAAAAMVTMSHVRLGRTMSQPPMSQPPPSEVVIDPRFQRRDSQPMPEKVGDPRVTRLHESRSQDSGVTSANVTDVRLAKALSVPSIPIELPSLLQTPPLPLHPGLKPTATDPRMCKTQGTSSASSSGDDQGDSPQHVTQHADSQRPLLSHRNDPRFKKRHKAVSDAPALQSEINIVESEPINPPPPQRRGMEYSSPLGSSPLGSEAASETSASNAYNRPPNSRFQQLQQQQQHQKQHHFKSAKGPPNNGKTTTLQNSIASSISSQVAPVVTTTATAMLELTPEQLQLPPGAVGDEPSLKDMFKTFDPTASPFC